MNEPSSWGNARDALSAVHNLETLVKSPRIGRQLIAAVFPELYETCRALRRAFSVTPNAPREELRDFANERVAALEAALHEADCGSLDTKARLRLEHEVARLGRELDAATELLELSERAERPAPTEHSARELARVSLSLAAAIRPHGSAQVKLDVSGPDGLVVSDAHVLARLLVHAVSWAKSFGPDRVLALRPRADDERVRFVIEPANATDAALPVFTMSTLMRIPPTDAVLFSSVKAIGAWVEADTSTGSGELSLARAPG